MAKPYIYHLDPNKSTRTASDYHTILKARTLLFTDKNIDAGLAFSRSVLHKHSPVSNYMQAYLCIMCGLVVISGHDKWRCCSDAYNFIYKEMHAQKVTSVRDLDQEVMGILLVGIKILHDMIKRYKVHMGFCCALEQMCRADERGGEEVDLGLGIEVAVHDVLGLDLDYDLHKE